ncbi:beta-lactamase/transpeptidase-like protein [Stachybotrys elegans]|uniref:Beta-lactamase/transpeptidase-like protein n=1 Tax=Stachybotrys elegans TaxID=80388 RepID=A0A8K0WNY1_9HYPO|nr:beta-lactamase/transpeptidase-like protein [Stachybotrys elegans]
MALDIDTIYDKAIASGMLPGVSYVAGDKDGNILYSKSMGRANSTMGTIASMVKIMTSVAVLQCVKDGWLHLDNNIKSLLPNIGKYGVITAFDDATNSAYDWFSLSLTKWKVSRGGSMWSGWTVEEKSTLPLVFVPGTSFVYSASHDWVGKAENFSFYPEQKETMAHCLAAISTLNEQGEPPAVNASSFNIRFGSTDCFRGRPCWATLYTYLAFLFAMLCRDLILLGTLDKRYEQALNKYIAQLPMYTQLLGLGIAPEHRRIKGRCSEGTVMWAGATTSMWFIDPEARTYGIALCQLLPPLYLPVVELYGKF